MKKRDLLVLKRTLLQEKRDIQIFERERNLNAKKLILKKEKKVHP